MDRISVAITDDHPLVIDGVVKALSPYKKFWIQGTFLNGTGLLAHLQKEQPDILLLDIQMPGLPGDELAKTIHEQYPAIGIIALTGFDSPIYIRSMIHNGCRGYLLKSADQQTLVTAIQTVYEGSQYLEASIKEIMLDYSLAASGKRTGQHPALTTREKEILSLITEEYTSAEIAQKLFLGQRTVEKYRLQLLQKLQVKNTAGLVKVALQMGLIHPGL